MKKLALTAIAAIFLCSMVCVLSSCESRPYTAKVKILENNTVTIIKLKLSEYRDIVANDTIWVDLDKHEINDTCSSAMKAVVINAKPW